MSSKKVFQDKEDPVNALRQKTKNMLANKYYNLFMNTFEFKGIDDNQQDYLRRKFWANGTVAAFPIKNTDEIGFTLYTPKKVNMYDSPEQVVLINKWNVPFMPEDVQIVNKDVVLGYIQPNRKGICEIVNHYINKLVNVEMVINTNLTTHKLPFFIGVNPEDRKKMEDVVKKIMNDETVIFSDLEDLQSIKALITASPYIIDKLYSYKTSVENELLTYLGIDNVMRDDTKQNLTLDAVNANNALINANLDGMLDCLKSFCKRVKEVLHYEMDVEPAHKPVQSVYEGNSNIPGEGNNSEVAEVGGNE